MKLKNFVLTTAFSLFCLLGCSCAKEPPKDSGGSSSDEPVYQETTTIISLNQTSVTFCVGESFTLIADSTVEGAAFTWSIDGNASQDVVSLAQTGNTAVITALSVGETKLIAAMQQEDCVYFRTVEVFVREASDVVLVLSDNVGFDEKGYHVRLSTLETENGDVRTINPIISAYKNNQVVVAENVRWTSENPDVAQVTGNTFLAVGEGKTNIIGECTVDGKTYSISVAVEAYRPKIALNEHFVVDLNDISELSLTSSISGSPRAVVYEGKTVGQYEADGKTARLIAENFPKTSALLGENRSLYIETNVASYVVSVDVYTKILHTKEDFESFSTLAKQANEHAALWDGYFVLGADIVYNGLYNSKLADHDSLYAAIGDDWHNGGLYGFKGVFDGKGYNVEGVSIDKGRDMGSIFGVLHVEGVIKNISFTKASVAANNAFVCAAGGGTIENIYIQYASMGQGTQRYEGDGITINNFCGSFFSFKEPTLTASITNCVIDVTDTVFDKNNAIKIVGNEHIAKKDVFVIGGTQDLQNNSNATQVFASNVDFADNADAQNRYKNFSPDFWSKEKGVPVSKAVYQKICAREVEILGKVECFAAGTSYLLPLNNYYARITSNHEGIHVSGNVLTIAHDVQAQSIVITATSIFDESKQDSFTCSVVVLNFADIEDLTAEAHTAFYDLTEKKVYLAELGERVEDEILYYTTLDGRIPAYAEDGLSGSLLAVSENKFYKINYQSVTKVIDDAEDLHYIRREKTVDFKDVNVTIAGCYDGLLRGTFVLINDIDCTGLQLNDTGKYWENSRGFNGVFDGRGYTISNLTVGKNGLFGMITKATIKNVHFQNVKLIPDTANGTGAYVSLLATGIFNSTIENVSAHFASYVAGENITDTSGLLYYETSYDSVFKNITIDISLLENVKYLMESRYTQESVPFGSKEKSTYENIIVILKDLEEKPVFAYDKAIGTAEDVVDYPEGSFTFKERDCIVSFDTDGAGDMDPIFVGKGGKIPEPKTPNKTTSECEYDFLGWYYGEKKWDFSKDVVTEDITLVAHWQEGDKYSNPFLPKD